MTNLIAEANVSTGEFVQRPMTDEELLADEIHRAKRAITDAEELALLQTSAIKKQNVLEKLGLTEDEAKLLLS